ncbi:fibronectin type III domain-containing protein 7-like [Thalassophryne amazonica]|uniref:fibronectin type III domain-containing protein 7-like n=1 Tax=Thalassophryne amazonica TaxID=390379 RepID=UPI001471723F|nr:fibronectin type III domain-containing protein 7-like [Thalassophryne amazonica]
MISWTSSAGAQFYTATITNEDGQSKACLSNVTQCGIADIRCGQTYTVTVVASNQQCDSEPSDPDAVESVPCVPTDVMVKMDCSKNMAHLSWNASKGALSYKAMVVNSRGHPVSSCEVTDLMCYITNLACGQSYSTEVVALDDTCSSLPSKAVSFNSVPCTPNISSVALDCYTNSALLSWGYAKGAVYYTATAQSANSHVSTCQSNFTNCELQKLMCGQTYTVFTMASDGQCDSPPSTSLQVDSVPCAPEAVVAEVDCTMNSARVEWQSSIGANSYIVQAIGLQEHTSGCETHSQSCIISDLMCGFTYNISVLAVNSVCNVTESTVTQLQTVPCVPQQVEARVDCSFGDVAVSWEHSKGASSYTTVAMGNGGYAATCNSSETSCHFSNLLCGISYSITVSASSDECASAGSTAVQIDTVPCVPQNVFAEIMCSNNTGLVSWEEGDGATSYMVHAYGLDGHRTKCNSTATSCQLPSMHCGQLYNLTLTAQDGQCDNSNAYLSLQSAPCSPTNVKAALQCHLDSAAVTWEQASGASAYHAVGVTADGHYRQECNNTETYCDLNNLLCGQTYNVSVFSHDESCSSLESDRAYVRTVPCAPQDVAVAVSCAEGAMTISWSPNPDAEYFHVLAVSNNWARLHCNSSGSACTIRGLTCGQSYNITVISVRDGCESKKSAAVHVYSAPCVPTKLFSRLDCVTNNAWVTWDTSDGASSYFVLAQSGRHSSSCSDSSSTCSVPDLKCSTLYSFYITAINKDCHSNQSSPVTLQTGPCAFTSISAVTQCNSDTILVEWEVMGNTRIYLVTAEGHDQSILTCNTTSSSCVLQDVRCGMHYSIIVATASDKCSSLRSPPKKITTAPCVPEDVAVALTCEDDGATVSWAPSDVAISYQVTAKAMDGQDLGCVTSSSNCSLHGLHCGQTYNLSVTASSHNCSGEPSISSFRSVPCAPVGLAVDIQCENNSAILSWNATEGTVEYFGCAQTTDGDMLYCGTTDATCTIEGLECGHKYNFSVEASTGVCNSSVGAPLLVGAVPCAPNSVDVRLQEIDQSQWVMVTFEAINCSDVEYLVEISGQIEGSQQAQIMLSSYWTSRIYFEFPVPCSTWFIVIVRSRNSAGIGKSYNAFTGITAPCPPQNARYTGDKQSAVLSWDASVFAQHYTVYSTSTGKRVMLCDTTALSCQLTNFDPSTTEVTASNAAGESNPQRTITAAS